MNKTKMVKMKKKSAYGSINSSTIPYHFLIIKQVPFTPTAHACSVLHSDINSPKSGLLHLTGKLKSKAAIVKDGIRN